jgi:hypothetical protein
MMNEPLNVNVKICTDCSNVTFLKKIKVSCGVKPLVGITSQECRTVRRHSDVSRNNVIPTPLTATDSVCQYNYIPTDGASAYLLIPTILELVYWGYGIVMYSISNIRMGHLQHAKDADATCSKRLQPKQETITSHANIDIKPMQHRYAPNTTSVNNNCDIKKRLQT